ncbi:hypothetical protein [Mycoplasmopsis felis]|nr:hypothetical protein [Mycoplasmopsis felis]UWV83791.1 hypothetical protein NWE58_05875 [Mycoplasmopsis felis]
MKRIKFNKLIGILTLFGMISTSVSLNFKEVEKIQNKRIRIKMNMSNYN